MMPDPPRDPVDMTDLRPADEPESKVVRRWFCEPTDRTFVLGFAWCRGNVDRTPSVHLGLGFWAVGVEWVIDDEESA